MTNECRTDWNIGNVSCKKLLRVRILAIINICFKSLLRGCLFKHQQSHIGEPDEAWTAVERKTYYGVTCWRYVVARRSANQWALELPWSALIG
jgi:hypothetical protein